MSSASIVPGSRFGKIVILGPAVPYVNPNSGRKAPRLEYLCDCGTRKSATPYDIRKGRVKSCGCAQGRQTVQHGHSRRGAATPEYVVWASMLTRCTNPNSAAWRHYGGRGITVCTRWLQSFENFYADMGPRPDGMTLDRIDNNKGYSPENCAWVSRKAQSHNTRRNRYIEYDGKTLCLSDWARHLGIAQATLSSRLKNGWPLDRALVPKHIIESR
jgi:hypothetical protein